MEVSGHLFTSWPRYTRRNSPLYALGRRLGCPGEIIKTYYNFSGVGDGGGSEHSDGKVVKTTVSFVATVVPIIKM